MPTDRHAATGTCELGEPHIRIAAWGFKFFLSAGTDFLQDGWPPGERRDHMLLTLADAGLGCALDHVRRIA